jgi:phosphoglucomutase
MEDILLTLDQSIKEKVQKWLEGNYDDETKNEIKKLIKENNVEELTNSFYKDLEFGTGGLRGLMGVGTNKMNKYTVAAATQGLANYLIKTFKDEKIKVAIAYDSRKNSNFFASISADVFSANGIEVYVFESLRPTPVLSYAIRYFKCHSGVVITASHNPKEYNGYKAYWSDGAQLVPPHDVNVIDEVKKITKLEDIKLHANKELIHNIGLELDDSYIEKTVNLSLSRNEILKHKDLKIVYTPLHGTGITIVPKMLKRFGFENIHIVQEQAEPNGDFPTVKYPNPEEPEALNLALEKAKNIDADLILATDPDADRVGVAVKNQNGSWKLLNGNQTGTLLFYYLLYNWDKQKKLKGNEYVVKTIVTTDIIDKIAKKFGVECYNTLTGFKYIAEIIRLNEGKKTYIVGGEESYGYLVGDFVRDKDAVGASAFIAEMTAWAKDQGMSLFELLINIYREFGFYKEHLISITKKGKSGTEEIKEMMKRFRQNPPEALAGSKIVKMLDYENGIEKDFVILKSSKLNYPHSDVLQFLTEDDTKVSVRPSGTEPKIKFYVSVNLPLKKKEDFEFVENQLQEKINTVLKDLNIS